MTFVDMVGQHHRLSRDLHQLERSERSVDLEVPDVRQAPGNLHRLSDRVHHGDLGVLEGAEAIPGLVPVADDDDLPAAGGQQVGGPHQTGDLLALDRPLQGLDRLPAQLERGVQAIDRSRVDDPGLDRAGRNSTSTCAQAHLGS